ncbi:unnamed protein product, partial [Porites lobata]
RRVLYVIGVVAAFLCFAGSSATFTAIFVVFCSHCSRPNSLLVWLNGLAAVSLAAIGITILYFVIFGCREGDNTENDADVVISEIPAEDVEKSPAPVIPYNHIPHYSPFVQPSSRDLPDYFTTIQNSNGGDLPDYYNITPPCYEKALEMTRSGTAYCASPNTLLLWVHLVGAFLLFAIGMKTLVTITFSRGRQNTPPARVLISDARTGDLEDSPAILSTHRIPRRLLFVVNPLHNLVPRQNQATEDLSWRDLPDYFTALQNSNDARVGETHFNEAFCTEYVPTTPPPCYEEALEMTLIAIS